MDRALRQKVLQREKKQHLGDRPKKLHRSVDFDSLEDAIELNANHDGFVFNTHRGGQVAVRRPRNGGMLVSVCTVMNVKGSGGEALVELWDETLQQGFALTPNDAMISENVDVKRIGTARVVFGAWKDDV